jgi:hypothetical protein
VCVCGGGGCTAQVIPLSCGTVCWRWHKEDKVTKRRVVAAAVCRQSVRFKFRTISVEDLESEFAGAHSHAHSERPTATA